jgi:FMN phosphatase YigB (HAD superfamily)
MPSWIDGARVLLDWTHNRFNMALVTRGNEELQLRKLSHIGAEKYFEYIEVVNDKSSATFLSIMKRFSCSPSSTWIVVIPFGTDINPGIEARANCIHYAYKHDHYHWLQEHGDTPRESISSHII